MKATDLHLIIYFYACALKTLLQAAIMEPSTLVEWNIVMQSRFVEYTF